MQNDPGTNLFLAKAHIAELHADAARERLAREARLERLAQKVGREPAQKPVGWLRQIVARVGA